MTRQPPQPIRPETDASVWWRARRAGWTPRPKHCPADSARLAAGWREDAERFLVEHAPRSAA